MATTIRVLMSEYYSHFQYNNAGKWTTVARMHTGEAGGVIGMLRRLGHEVETVDLESEPLAIYKVG